MSQQQQWSPSVSDAFDVFRLHCQAQRYSPATLAFYDRRLPRLVAWLTARNVADLASVTPNHLRAYLVERQDSGASPHYLHGIARALRTWFAFCVAEGYLVESPMRNVAMPKLPRAIKPAFDEADLRAILKAASTERDKAIVLMLLDTGLRAAEMVALLGGDIDVHSGAIDVRHGKGDKRRTVYMGSKTLRALLRYFTVRGKPAPDAHVWVSSRPPHTALTYFGLAQLLRRLGAHAGVPCTAHTFRRTFALQCLRNGMDIYSLQRLMGHEDLETVKIYLALAEADIQRAQQAYSPADRWRL